ncbi:MAG TPA: type II secretion system protein GspM [Myxococcota bacterium]|jgi:hypothetical protein|nr:type II secretion system protein GspM [Myxococcota bacterium]
MKEKLNQLLDRLDVAWEGLAERERMLVASLGGVLLVFVLFVGWFFSSSAIAERRERLDEMTTSLADIEAAAADYGAREGERKAHEARLDREVPSLKGHLEEVAGTSGIAVDSFGSEKRTPAKGKKYDEATVEVKFRRVELHKITDYMKRLETDPQFVFVIKRLNMRVDFSDKSLLNVEMEVATYIRVAPLEKPAPDEGAEGDEGAAPVGPGKAAAAGAADRGDEDLGDGEVELDMKPGARPTGRPVPARVPGAPPVERLGKGPRPGMPPVKLPPPPEAPVGD